jgi:hypothetical protein
VPDFDKEDDRLSIKEADESFSSEEEVKADENARNHTTIDKVQEQFAKKTLGQQNIMIEEDDFEEDKNIDAIF